MIEAKTATPVGGAGRLAEGSASTVEDPALLGVAA